MLGWDYIRIERRCGVCGRLLGRLYTLNVYIVDCIVLASSVVISGCGVALLSSDFRPAGFLISWHTLNTGFIRSPVSHIYPACFFFLSCPLLFFLLQCVSHACPTHTHTHLSSYTSDNVPLTWIAVQAINAALLYILTNPKKIFSPFFFL